MAGEDAGAGAGPGRALAVVARMRARRRDEEHRVGTPLELFFDLSFAAAVAQAGQQLVHALAAGEPGHGLAGYLLVFFAIWWAWMNFTWFASAYDVDDVPYRLATLVQIAGVLVLAAGIPRAFAHADYAVAVTGYVVMRVALIAQWLRAAHGETGAGRKAAMTYAGALAVVQAGWVLLLLLPAGAWVWGVGILIMAELAAPAVAERVRATPWHAEHIADRYGAFTIIVLGESISAATVAVQSALDETPELGELLPIAFGGLVIVFTAFWVYFATPIDEYLQSSRRAFAWGYGHYPIFGSAAAIGAGLEVATEQVTHHSHISDTAAALAVTGPAALYTAAVWLVHVRPFKRGAAQQLVLPVMAVLVLAATFAGHWAVPLAALAGAAGVGTGLALAVRRARADTASPPPGGAADEE